MQNIDHSPSFSPSKLHTKITDVSLKNVEVVFTPYVCPTYPGVSPISVCMSTCHIVNVMVSACRLSTGTSLQKCSLVPQPRCRCLC